MDTSPFTFDRPVPPEDLVGRSDIVASLHDRAAHGRFVLLAAPRRFGKTSVIRRLAHDGAATGDLHVVHVDLLGVQEIDDVIRRFGRALDGLPTEGALRRALQSIVRRAPDLAANIGWGALSVTARRPPPEKAESTLESMLDLPEKASEQLGAPVLVVLDEFQDIDRAQNADTTIRSVIQHQDRVSYLFAGSEPSTMEAIFGDRRRALYAQAERIRLGPLPDDELGAFLEDRFASTERGISFDALMEYLTFVEGHPQRSMLLAHHLWQATQPRTAASIETLHRAVENALEAFSYEGASTLSGLTESQAKVLRLLAHGEPLHGTTARHLGLAKSTASNALDRLRSAAIAAGDPPRPLDPLMAEWLRRQLPLS